MRCSAPLVVIRKNYHPQAAYALDGRHLIARNPSGREYRITLANPAALMLLLQTFYVSLMDDVVTGNRFNPIQPPAFQHLAHLAQL